MDSPFDDEITKTITSWGDGGLAEGVKVFGDRFLLEKRMLGDEMQQVWRVHDAELGEKRVLKFLPPLMARDRLAESALRLEAAQGRKLSHPRIVNIDDFLKDEDYIAISREYVDGETLERLLGKRQKEQDDAPFFEPDEIDIWVRDIASALEYAHGERDMPHRDLCPACIVVDQKGHAKVADFGLGRQVSETHSRLTGWTGSEDMHYSSPGIVMGDRPTKSDDIYALGAIIYHLLAGRPPFWRGNVQQDICQKATPSIQQGRESLHEMGGAGKVWKEIPLDWERAVAACLAKESDERPQTIDDFLKLLDGKEESPVAPAADKTLPTLKNESFQANPRFNYPDPAQPIARDPVRVVKAAPEPAIHRKTDVEDEWAEDRQATSSQRKGGRRRKKTGLWVAGVSVLSALLLFLLLGRGGDDQMPPDNLGKGSGVKGAAHKPTEAPLAGLTAEELKRKEDARRKKLEKERKAKELAALKKRREAEAEQKVKTYLQNVYGPRFSKSKTEDLLASSFSRNGGSSSRYKTLNTITSMHKEWPTRTCRLERMETEISDDARSAMVSLWVEYDWTNAAGTVRREHRIKSRLAAGWDSSGDFELKDETRPRSKVSKTVYLTSGQKKAVGNMLEEYYRAAQDGTDISRFFHAPAYYVNFNARNLSEIRNKQRSTTNPNTESRYKFEEFFPVSGSGTSRMEIKASFYVWSRKKGDSAWKHYKVIDRLQVEFLKENGYEPRIKSVKKEDSIMYGMTASLDNPGKITPPEEKHDPGELKTNGIGMKLRWIPAGEFIMGIKDGNHPKDDERTHRVQITRGFWMGQYEVNQWEWFAVMRTYPSENGGNNKRPVENVSWNEAMEYCRRLTALARGRKEIDDKWHYTLPTEAQWEYAYAAGKTTHFHWGNRFTNGESANAENDYKPGSTQRDAAGAFRAKGWPVGKTMTAGRFSKNAWNLYDMSGNVWEYCRDVYNEDYTTQTKDPYFTQGSDKRVRRGGSFRSDYRQCRRSYRENRSPDNKSREDGFRVILAPVGH